MAVVVGIDVYANGVRPLLTAVRDARAIARLLADQQGYSVQLRLDAQASLAGLVTLFETELPALVGPDDRLLVYFAGHGTAQDGQDGPEGFLVPQDARPGQDARESLLPMSRVYQAIRALPCRHRLLLLDCCFAGSFRWSTHRSFLPRPTQLHRRRYTRFIEEPAAQVLTSAAANQQALDILDGMTLGRRGEQTPINGHSPFAAAVLAGLAGAADLPGPDGVTDGVITASELYLYVREVVERASERVASLQTPGLWPLPEHGRGEYIFGVPGRAPRLAEDPRLDAEANPWRGLKAYDARHASLFFGRTTEIAALRAQLERDQPVVAVLGASGTGKSSLVKAGLVPALKKAGWTIIGPQRPGHTPAPAMARAMFELRQASGRRLLVVDQLEELFTLGCSAAERQAVFEMLVAIAALPDVQIVLTLRSDFEAQFEDTHLGALLHMGRYVVPPMSRADLEAVILRPADLRVLYFEPPALVDTLIDEVLTLPGGLPLLSFTLAEMYAAHLERDAGDRALTEADYRALGGVTGALRTRASALLSAADEAGRATIRRLMLRLVSREGGELARRRVNRSELQYADAAENARMHATVTRFVRARLLVQGRNDGAETDDDTWLEPAHDALVLGWDQVYRWLNAAADHLPTHRALWRVAERWRHDRSTGLLWSDDPRLPLAMALSADLNAIEERFVQASRQRRVRRRWTLVAVVAAVILSLSGATIYAFDRADEADRQRKSADSQAVAAQQATGRAEAQTRLAQARRREAEAQRIAAEDALLLSTAQANVDTRPDRAAILLSEMAHPERSPLAWQMLYALAAKEGMLVDALDHANQVVQATYSPDGAWILTRTHDGRVRLWPADGVGRPVDLVDGGRVAERAVISPDSSQVAVGNTDGSVLVWTIATPTKPIRYFGHTDRVRAIAFSHDATRIATGSRDKTVRIWSLTESMPLFVLHTHAESVSALAFSPDDKWLASGDGGGNLQLNALANGEDRALSGHDRILLMIAFSADGAQLLTTSFDGTARVWSLTAVDDVRVLPHDERLTSAAFSPDGRWIVTTANDGIVRLWPRNGGSPRRLSGHQKRVLSARFDSNGQRLVTASLDGTARIWHLGHDDAPIVLRVPTCTVFETAEFSPDDRHIVTGCDGAAHVWAADGLGVTTIRAPAGRFQAAALRADGRRIASRRGTRFEVWDPLQPAVPVRLYQPKGQLTIDPVVAWRPGSDEVAIGGQSLWRWTPGAKPIELFEPWGFSGVTQIAYAPDGTRVAVGLGERPPRVLNARTGLTQAHLKWPRQVKRYARAMAFTSNGDRLAIAISNTRVGLWDVASGERLDDPIPDAHGGRALAFSPDGSRLLTAGRGGARIWTLGSDAAPIVLPSRAGHVYHARFTTDGRRVATGEKQGVSLWRTDGQLLARVTAERPIALGVAGDRLMTATAQTIQLWPMQAAELQAALRAGIRHCLPADWRVKHLRKRPAIAQREAERCTTHFMRADAGAHAPTHPGGP